MIHNSVLPWTETNNWDILYVIHEKQRVLSGGNILGYFVRVPWLYSFHNPTPFDKFLKRELSPFHSINTNCLRLTRDKMLDSSLFSSSSTPTWTCHALPQPPATCPFCPSSLSHPALPSVGCYWAGISQTLPLRPVTSSASRTSEGSSSSCESNPTYLCIFDSGERRVLRGHGGVESPRSLVSHYQTMPHHHCHHMIIDIG